MDTLTWAGVAACALAVAIVAALVLMPRRLQVDITRLDPSARPTPHGWARVAAEGGRLGEEVLRRLGRRAALTAALDRADVRRSPAQVLAVTVVGAIAAFVLGGVAAGPWAGLLLALLMPLAVVMTLRARAARRRAAFADQLDDTLRLMAASLRAGLSVQRALEAVSQDAEAPTSDEFSRVLNEVRVGRDLVAALEEVGERTASADFSWVAQAVAIHREVGGNLAEVLDRVGTTIRDRSELRRQAQTLSAEGRTTAIVLLTLPVLVGGALQVLSPGYMARLTGSFTGLVMLAIAGVLMVVGAVWVRRVVTVKF